MAWQHSKHSKHSKHSRCSGRPRVPTHLAHWAQHGVDRHGDCYARLFAALPQHGDGLGAAAPGERAGQVGATPDAVAEGTASAAGREEEEGGGETKGKEAK